MHEYGRWHDAFVSEAQALVTGSGGWADPFDFGQTWTFDLPYDFNPRRFVGQCIGMFLATQRSERLWVNHPILRKAIGAELPNDPSNPPGPVDLNEVRLFVSLANQDIVYSRDAAWAVTMSLGGVRNGGLVVPGGTLGAREVQVLVFSPFALTLSLDGSDAPWPAFDCSGWSQLGHHERFSKNALEISVPTVRGSAPFFPPPSI